MSLSPFSNEIRGVLTPPGAPEETRMGTWTMIKLGVAGFVLLGLLGTCGYYIWNYHHMAAKIEAQAQEIGNLKVGQETLDAKQQKYDDFMAKKTKVIRRVPNEQQAITQEANTVPDAGLDNLYDRYRVHPGNQVHPAPPGRKSGAQDRAAPAP